jgi:hypothetical protein
VDSKTAVTYLVSLIRLRRNSTASFIS